MIKAIDIHAHVFNLRYLPVAGILDGSALVNLPSWLAKALARLALAATREDDMLDAAPVTEGLEFRSPLGSEAAAEAVELARLIDEFEDRIEEIESRIAEEVWAEPEVRDALASAAELAPTLSPEATEAAVGGFRLRTLIALAKTIIRAAGGLVRTIDWLFTVAIARERAIVRRLLDTYGNKVDLFVHHMMDMKNHYRDGRTSYDFAPRQIVRMGNLSRLFPGRLATFVAWDPFRADGLDIVKDAVESRGCVGIKVYPPGGYRPWRNDNSDLADRFVQPPPPEVLDARSLALFRWCVSRDLPVFTHCTPEGFQAYPDSGANGSPDYWRWLLEDHDDLRALRLCFGHAGGEGWFANGDQGWSDSFASKVADLCTDGDYPNLYCEVGILSDVHEPTARRRFAERLRTISAARPQLLKRLLYGSDWHMLYMHEGHKDFFDDYLTFCADAGLTDAQRDDFFRNNALRYLKMADDPAAPE